MWHRRSYRCLFAASVLLLLCCRVIYSANVKRIIGGVDANVGEYPWIAFSFGPPTDGLEYFTCGGTLIAAQYVLTTASCCTSPYEVSSVQLGEFYAIGGFNEDDMIDLVGGAQYGGQFILVEEITIDPNYNNQTGDSDCCVVKLATPAVVSTFPRLNFNATIPNPKHLGSATALGWGGYGTGASVALQKVTIDVIDSETCQIYQPFEVTGTMLCAGDTDVYGAHGICFSDVGGPLYITVDGNPTLIGLSALVAGDACNLTPSLFSRVSALAAFICKACNNAAFGCKNAKFASPSRSPTPTPSISIGYQNGTGSPSPTNSTNSGSVSQSWLTYLL